MTGLKPLKPVAETQLGNRQTDDYLYWSRMKDLAIFQEPSNITSLAFSPIEPYHLASTSSMRLGIFDSVQGEAMMILSRFKSMVYGATFRKDGSLLGVGTHEGYAQLYDIYRHGGTNRKAIRMFKAHPTAVRDVAFTNESNHFATVSDDGCVAYWDLASPKTTEPLWQIDKAHSDAIRAVKFAENNENFMITGSYDHTIKVWDTRTIPESTNAAFVVDHGSPVEQILISSNDRFLFTAGGLTVKIWDLSCGGRFVHALEQHHKTVTSIALASHGTRIITGGIDRRVNVFSLDSGDFRLVYSNKVSSGVLALAISPNDERMALAMGNLLSIQHRSKDDATRKLISSDAPISISLTKQLSVGGAQVKKRQGMPVLQRERGNTQKVVELTAPRLDKVRLGRLDVHLKKGSYRAMVDFIFSTAHCLGKPELVVAAFEQIRLRQALPRVLANRSGVSLVRIISFLKHHMFKNQFFDTLYEVADVLSTVYADQTLEFNVIGHFRSLRRAIDNELKLQKAIAKSSGSLDLLIQASVAEHRARRNEQINSIFGDLSIHPITFRMSDEEKVLTDIDYDETEDKQEMVPSKKIKTKDLPPIARDSRKLPKGKKRFPKS